MERMASVRDLLNATSKGDVPNVQLLLAQGVDANARDEEGWFPLLTAAISAPRDLVKALLDAGARVNAQAPDGSTALMKAVLWRRVEIARLLLEHGADLGITDDRGWTAVQLARHLEHQELMAMLERQT